MFLNTGEGLMCGIHGYQENEMSLQLQSKSPRQHQHELLKIGRPTDTPPMLSIPYTGQSSGYFITI
jgi:hypothetical protein